MFIVDDILTAPFRAVHWILREIAAAASQEQQAEEARIKDELRALYMRLEAGQISEAEFDQEEGPLLDRLDQLEAAGGDDEEEGEEDEG